MLICDIDSLILIESRAATYELNYIDSQNSSIQKLIVVQTSI
jgi:hypothetical protein